MLATRTIARPAWGRSAARDRPSALAAVEF